MTDGEGMMDGEGMTTLRHTPRLRGSCLRRNDGQGHQTLPVRPGLVIAPSLAEATLRAYLANTPVV